MNRSAPVGFVVLLVFAVVAGACGPIAASATAAPTATTTGAATQSTPDATPESTPSTAMVAAQEESRLVSQETQGFDNTTFEITAHENGSATWTIRYERVFSEADNETEARENFETFAEEFRANETGLYDQFINQSDRLAEAGAQEAGREMEATNFRRSAAIEEQLLGREKGVVEMSFTWENFAVVEDDRIVVGDVFETLYISSDQAIVYQAGGDLSFRSIEPNNGEYAGTSLENAETVQWNGEREFIEGRPRAVFDRPDSGDGTGAVGDDDAGLRATIDDAELAWYLVGALLVIGLATAAVAWYRRSGQAADQRGTSGPDEAEATAGVTANAADTTGEGTGSRDAAETAEPGGSEPEPVPDEELMTDEDRVVKLIRENGGRMKQVNIVEETSWSKSKVSMLLSDMEEEGTISKLRVGRENIISLEGFEPEATKSPFEE
ncbi:helix-turn-helix transcriptional regulator [Natrinema salifodinae]|uniref:IclR helix-turn-helix domain-containing protein n=1 Tax=Natrinema salifodinae TaxID=1202768 RepID=A0A1I0M9B5_9EURY|nr:hypothetical protein [Natrinema salifodinae]SEV83961.1 hypothetical protein SAMN05216285_0555 [Natrinema salifodinae]